MKKKGNIWISAVLYFALGMILLSIILTSGMPVIERLRDKNIALQTKEVFQVMDQKILETAKGGPGNQKVLDLNIKKGTFIIDTENQEKYFCHVSGLIDEIAENDKVSFELEKGMKGMNAVRVKLI